LFHVDEYLATASDMFWVQRQNSPGTAAPGTPVTINDTAPPPTAGTSVPSRSCP
jgi:hypothetical protein